MPHYAANRSIIARVTRSSTRAWIATLVATIALPACSELLTRSPDPGDLFDAPLDGLSAAEQSAFARGDAAFSRRFSPSTGLGPIFNNVSCFSCHSGDGRGRPENALIRIGEPADDF